MSELVTYVTGTTVPATWLNRAQLREEGLANYVIYQTGGTVYAKALLAGATDPASGADFSTVLNAAISALPSTGSKIFIREGSYTVNTAISLVDGLELCGVWGQTKLVSAGMGAGIGILQTTGAIAKGVSIHDLYIQGNRFTSFPTFNGSIDSFGVFISAGLASHVQVYNLWFKNVGNCVWLDGGSQTGNCADWQVHHIIAETVNGVAYIHSKCTLAYNITVDNLIVDTFIDNIVEVAATNGGVVALGGELFGINISNLNGYNAGAGGSGLSIVSVETASTNGNKVHGIQASNIFHHRNRSYAGTNIGVNIQASGAANNDVRDWHISNVHTVNIDTPIKITLPNITIPGGGQIINATLENTFLEGILVANTPSAGANAPVIIENVVVNLNSAANNGIRLNQTTNNCSGHRFRNIKINGISSQTALKHDTGGSFAVSDIRYSGIEYTPGSMTVSIPGSNVILATDFVNNVTQYQQYPNKVKTGTPTDSDFSNPQDGLVVIDNTASKIWARFNTVWKGPSIAHQSY